MSFRFPPFSQCSSLVDKSAWLASCLDMTCECLQKGGESRECKCSALEDYVRQCRRHQPTIHLQDWRSMHLCREYFHFSRAGNIFCLSGGMPGGSCAPRLLPSQLRADLHLHPLWPILLPTVAGSPSQSTLPSPFPEWGLLPGLLLSKWPGQRGRHMHRAFSLLKLCLQVFTANPQPYPSFVRQKSGIGFSTFDGKNARLKPDKVSTSFC